jgi:dolichyl-diphosphooligosaccharide--protein glycosyltransferase
VTPETHDRDARPDRSDRDRSAPPVPPIRASVAERSRPDRDAPGSRSTTIRPSSFVPFGRRRRPAATGTARDRVDARPDIGSGVASPSTEGADTDTDASLATGGVPEAAASPGTLSIGSRRAGVVGVVVAIVAATVLRAYDYATVIRPWGVVPPANDPYVYLWLVERAAAATGTPLGAATAAAAAAGRDHLFVALLAWVASATGTPAVAVVWYPVVAAAGCLVGTYLLMSRVTGDRTVGVAAALLLAIVPAHATRTRIGFADHHAFDFLLLTAAAFAVVVALSPGRPTPPAASTDPDGDEAQAAVAGRVPGRVQYAAGVLAGLLAATQVLAWRGGVILLVPLALGAAAVALSTARSRSPVAALTPVLLGLLVAAFAIGVADETLGWGVGGAAGAVVALLGVVFVTTLLAEAGSRANLRPRWTALLGTAGLVATAGAALVAIPEVRSLRAAAEAYLAGTAGSGVSETTSLFAGQFGLVAGPLVLFGLVAPLALVGAVLAVRELARRDRPGLVVLLVYAGTLLVYAAVQRRFAGELAPFAAGLAAIGLVATLQWLLADAPVPTGRRSARGRSDEGRDRESSRLVYRSGRPGLRSTVASAVVVVLLMSTATVGAAGVASGAASVAADETWVETGRWVASDVAEADLSYPASYVLTPWPESRRVNYLVGDPALPRLDYDYARNTYVAVVGASDPDAVYPRIDGRVGYLAVTPVAQPTAGVSRGVSGGSTPPARPPLTATSGLPDLAHYRLVHDPTDGNRVYRLVPGATVVVPLAADADDTGGLADPVSARPTATATVAVGGAPSTYRRTATLTADGWAVATVAYPGVYDVTGTDRTVTVTEADVQGGRFVGPSPSPSDATAVWRFAEGSPDPTTGREPLPVAVDATGASHGRLVGTATRSGAGADGVLRLDGEGVVVVPGDPLADAAAGRVTVTFRTEGPLGQTDRPRLVAAGDTRTYPTTAGYVVGLDGGQLVAAVGDGDDTAVLRGPPLDDGAWHTVSLEWDGETVRLVADGAVVASRAWSGGVVGDGEVVIGANYLGNRGFIGEIDEVRLARP